MKLTIATAFVAASTFPSSIPTSRVAASILEHENSKGSVRTAVKTKGVECAIVDSFAVRKLVQMWGSSPVVLGKCVLRIQPRQWEVVARFLYLPMMKLLLWNVSVTVNSVRSV